MKREELISISLASSLLGLSSSRVRQLADRGDLPALRIANTGTRLFSRDQVERFAAERVEKRAVRKAQQTAEEVE